MIPWKQWCRLCARENLSNSHISVFIKDGDTAHLTETIKKCFSINLNHQDDWPQMICKKCYQFITTIMRFAARTSKVQAMFTELFNASGDLDREQLKAKYELDDSINLELDFKMLVSSPGVQLFESKPNMSMDMVEELIDVKQLDCNQEQVLNPLNIKTEKNINDDYSDVNEADWLNHLPSHRNEDSEENACFSPKSESSSDEESKKTGRSTPLSKIGNTEPYKCDDCNKVYLRYPNYRHHMRTEHGITLEPAEFPCTICNKTFSTSVQLRKHATTHLPLEQKLTKQCPHCDRRFCKNAAVKAHIRGVHMGVKPFICEQCGKTCKTFVSLGEHRLTHTEERPFKCSYCEKCFKNKLTLKIHEDTHNDNYICTICGLELNTRRTLNMHMVVHSDQKRHKCGYCGNEYKRAKALKNHLILHTGQKPYTCNFCGKSFANGSNCRSHKKKSHPVELAAMEAAGTKIITANIPNLKQLRVATANKACAPMDTGSTVAKDEHI